MSESPSSSPRFNGATKPNRLRMVPPVIKRTLLHRFTHPNVSNHIFNLKVTRILLNGWIWPIGEVALKRVCPCSLQKRIFNHKISKFSSDNFFLIDLVIKLVNLSVSENVWWLISSTWFFQTSVRSEFIMALTSVHDYIYLISFS